MSVGGRTYRADCPVCEESVTVDGPGCEEFEKYDRRLLRHELIEHVKDEHSKLSMLRGLIVSKANEITS